MVKGLDVFKDHFKGHEGNYVIIGGTACNAYEELMQQEPRAEFSIRCTHHSNSGRRRIIQSFCYTVG